MHADHDNSVLKKLASLAETAQTHAQMRYRIRLQRGAWKRVDDILNREREQGSPQEVGALSLCYGCWIGQALVEDHGGDWIGLNTPFPPRVRVAGMTCSPIDAVRRRVQDPAAPPVAQLVESTLARRSALPNAEPEKNQAAWDRMTQDERFVSPELPDEESTASLDPWLTGLDLRGKSILCLAAGGGRHGPLYARAGGMVTVVDASQKMLAIDEALARRHRLEISTVQTDMRDLSIFPAHEFDMVIQPVSSCYVPEVKSGYSEVHRVLKPGGRYLVQHKNPVALQTSGWVSQTGGYLLIHPGECGQMLSVGETPLGLLREKGMTEFIHPLQSLLGDLCRTGFVIEDVEEPVLADQWSPPGTLEHLSSYTPPYLKILARKRGAGLVLE